MKRNEVSAHEKVLCTLLLVCVYISIYDCVCVYHNILYSRVCVYTWFDEKKVYCVWCCSFVKRPPRMIQAKWYEGDVMHNIESMLSVANNFVVYNTLLFLCVFHDVWRCTYMLIQRLCFSIWFKMKKKNLPLTRLYLDWLLPFLFFINTQIKIQFEENAQGFFYTLDDLANERFCFSFHSILLYKWSPYVDELSDIIKTKRKTFCFNTRKKKQLIPIES